MNEQLILYFVDIVFPANLIMKKRQVCRSLYVFMPFCENM